eukprot:2898782-Pyramimonas_sp.AAC.3
MGKWWGEDQSKNGHGGTRIKCHDYDGYAHSKAVVGGASLQHPQGSPVVATVVVQIVAHRTR